ncbi:hypothetical protein EGW08_003196, partial [Elysia chlorotica]
SGQQGGRSYNGTEKAAYLPASDKGTKVLRLLRVAFLRGLIFCIKDTRAAGRRGDITWSDILHKTSFEENSPYGYPDPFYLNDVTKVLADKGVTEESMTEQERRDSSKIFRKLEICNL